MKSAQILSALRQKMAQSQVAAYLIPSGDAHQSEYIAACDARRAFVSGFTGSAGYAVVTNDKAALWTDGRYFLQCDKQLDKQCWELMKVGQPETPERSAWLRQVLPENSAIGFDPKLLSIEEVFGMRRALEGSGLCLKAIENNLVDEVWTEIPRRPSEPVTVLELKYAGQDYSEKLQRLRKYLQDSAKNQNLSTKPFGFLITALDEICWFFNLRGSDITFNPVFFAYALVTETRSILYTDILRLDDKVKVYLKSQNVELFEYHDVFRQLSQLSDSFLPEQKLLASSTCNYSVALSLGNDEMVEIVQSPVQKFKSIKNGVEMDGFRNCHLRDAAALCNFFGWLENELIVKNTSLSEIDAADKAEEFRSQQSSFVGLSFDTISGSGANGAVIHYKPEPQTCAKIDKDKVYLCDSGAQYLDGTTDVTRTYHFGVPTEFEKLAFTRVLQGHIAIDTAVFPHGTTGYIIDSFARRPLWSSGLDYRHGTGHGVGHYLNVHEGPHGIGFRKPFDNFPLEEGMTVTNEPGYYHDGFFGIRIENVLLVRKVNTPHQFGEKPFLGFEHITLVPMGHNLIDTSLLSEVEKKWINEYHRECWIKVSPLLEPNSLGWLWLQKETQILE